MQSFGDLRARPDKAELIRLVPAGGVLAVWAVFMFRTGGFDPGTWLPCGLVLLGLLLASVIGSGTLLPSSRTMRRALALLAAYVVWNYVSILWADARGPALEASNLVLLAALSTWTLSLAPWRAPTAAAFALGFSVLAGVVCVIALLTAIGADDLTSRFTDFRWNPPLDYPNSTSAFAFMAAIPPLVLAAAKGAPLLLRAGGLGLATLLCEFALLPQSRGAVIGIAATVLILIAVGPRRWALAIRIAVCAAIVVVCSGPVLDVYTVAVQTNEPSSALGPALRAVLLAGALGVVAGALLAFADDRIRLEDAAATRVKIAGWVAIGLAVVAGLGVGASRWDGISETLSDNWASLKNPGITFAEGKEQADDGSARFDFADPLERYDYWRVALIGLKENPIGGAGAGNFATLYNLERRYPKVSKYPHNLAMKALGDTGLVGFGLALALVVALVWGLISGWRTRPPEDRMLAVAAIAVGGYFLAHGMFDWLEAYPILLCAAAGIPMLALGVREHSLLVAAAHERGRRTIHRRERLIGRRGAIATGVGAVAIVLLLFPAWIADRYQQRATDGWRTNPELAYRNFDRAAKWNPVTAEPLTLKGVIALTRGDDDIALDAFRRSFEREEAFLPELGVAIVASSQGDLEEARKAGKRAIELDSRDPNLPDIVERLGKRRVADPAATLREALTSPFFTTDQLS